MRDRTLRAHSSATGTRWRGIAGRTRSAILGGGCAWPCRTQDLGSGGQYVGLQYADNSSRFVRLKFVRIESWVRALIVAWQVVSTDASPSEDVIRQTKLRKDGCSGEPLFVTFSSVAECSAAVAALHGREVAGQQRLWARQLSGEGQHHKKWRLIIRNLSFKVRRSCPPAPPPRPPRFPPPRNGAYFMQGSFCKGVPRAHGPEGNIVSESCSLGGGGGAGCDGLTLLSANDGELCACLHRKSLQSAVIWAALLLRQVTEEQLRTHLSCGGFVWDVLVAMNDKGAGWGPFSPSPH